MTNRKMTTQLVTKKDEKTHIVNKASHRKAKIEQCSTKKDEKTNESKKKKEPNRKVKIEQYVFHQNPGLNSSSQ